MADKSKGVYIAVEVDDKGSVVIKNFAGQFNDAMSKMRDNQEKAATGATSMFGRMEKAYKGIKGNIVELAAAVYSFKKAWDMVELGAKLEKQRLAFRNLAATYGESADHIIDKLREVSKATLDESEIIQLAGQAMMRGMKPDDLYKLMEIARAASKITGESTRESFERIEEAASMQRARALKFLGIVIDVQEANERYATTIGKVAENLNDEETRQAYVNEVITQGTGIIDRMGKVQDTYSLKIAQWKTQLIDIKDFFANVFLRVFQALVGTIDLVATGLVWLAQKFVAFITVIAELQAKLPFVGKYIAGVAVDLEALNLYMKGAVDNGWEMAKSNYELAFSFEDTAASAGKMPEPLEKTAGKAKKLAEAQNKLNEMIIGYKEAIEKVGQSDYEQKITEITKKYEKQRLEIQKTGKGIADITEAMNLLNQAERSEKAEAVADAHKRLNDQVREFDKIINKATLSEYAEKLDEITAKYEKQREELKKTSKGAEGYAEAMGKLNAAEIAERNEFVADTQDKINKKLADYNVTIQNLGLDEYHQKLNQITNDYTEQAEEITRLYKDSPQYGELMAKNQEAMIAAQNQTLIDENTKTYETMADAYKDIFIESITQDTADGVSFIQSIFNKLKNFAASIFAQMAANALANISMMILGVGQAQSAISGSGGGGGGLLGMLGGGGGGGFNPFSLFSAGKSGYNAYTSGSFYGISTQYGAQIQLGANTAFPANTWATNYVPISEGGQIVGYSPTLSGLGTVAAGAGVLGGGYGIYSAYKSGSPGMGAVSGGIGGYAAGSLLASYAGMGAAAGPWGAAIGAVIGLIAGLMGGDDAIKKRIEMMKTYFEDLKEAAETEHDSLRSLFNDLNNVTDKQYMSAVEGYSGLDKAITEQIFTVGTAAKEYKKASETYGEASAATIGEFEQMKYAMESMNAKAVTWGESGRGIAAQWNKIYEQMIKLQTQAITEKIATGAGLLQVNLEKLRELGLTPAAEASAKYEAVLGVLANDTIPALSSELTVAREALKSANAEMEKAKEVTAGLEVKTKLLLSSLTLSSRQLEIIKYGKVANDVIALYEAMGWYDKELEIVTTKGAEAESVWDAMSESAGQLQNNLKLMAEQFKGMKDINPELLKVYEEMSELAIAIQRIAETGKALSELPETFESLAKAIEKGDLGGAAAEVTNISNVLLQLEGTLEAIKADLDAINAMQGLSSALGNISKVLATGNEILMIVVTIMEVMGMVQKIGQGFMKEITQYDEAAAAVNKFIDGIEKILPRLAKHWREVWFIPKDESIISTLKDALGMGIMTPEQAGGVYQKYADEAKYGGMSEMGRQIAMINEEASRAIEALNHTYQSAYEMALADGKLTKQEQENLLALSSAVADAIEVIKSGSEEAVEKIKREWGEELQKIIDTSGMSDLGLQVYNLNEWYREQIEIAGKDADAIRLVNQAMAAQIDILLKDFLKPFQEIIDTAGMNEYQKQAYTIKKQTSDAIAAYTEAFSKLSYYEQMEHYAEFLEGIAAITEAGKALFKKAIDDMMSPVTEIIATAGMTDQEKQIYNINRQFDDLIAGLIEMGATQEQIDQANLARRIEIGEVERAIIEQQKELLAGLVDSINQKITDISTSRFNIWANPQQMTANYGEQWAGAMSAMRVSSTPEELSKNYSALSGIADKYLEQALSTYGNTAQYAAIYQAVMAGLEEARGMAQFQQSGLSEYESRTVVAIEDTASYSRLNNEFLSSLPEQKTAIDTTNSTLNGLRGDVSTSNNYMKGILDEVEGQRTYNNTFIYNQNLQYEQLVAIASLLYEVKEGLKKSDKNVSIQIDGREIAKASYKASQYGYRVS